MIVIVACLSAKWSAKRHGVRPDHSRALHVAQCLLDLLNQHELMRNLGQNLAYVVLASLIDSSTGASAVPLRRASTRIMTHAATSHWLHGEPLAAVCGKSCDVSVASTRVSERL